MADANTVTGALWDTRWELAHEVGLRTGLLTAAAAGWVRARCPHSVRLPHHKQAAAAADTASRWAAWAGDDSARVSFLVSSWTQFTIESDLLAAGCALSAQPAHT